MTFAPGTKIITVGDSITDRGNAASATKVSNQADSVIHWALLDTPAFRHGIYYDATATPGFRGSNFGIAGDSATMLLDRLPSVLRSALAQGAKISVLLIGSNTGTTDFVADSKKERIRAILDELTHAGLTVLISTIMPRAVTGTGFSSTVTTAYMQELLAVNTYIRSLSLPGVLVWDAWNDIIDPQYPPGHDYYGTPLASMTVDGAHFSPLGAFTAAQRLKTILQSLASSNDLWSGTWFNSSPSQSGNRLLDGSFVGSAGTAGTGMTGQVPTNWTASLASPAQVGGIASVSPNAATGGNTARFILTSAGAGIATAYERMSFVPAAARVNEPSMTAGNWARLLFKVRIQNPGGNLGAVSAVLANTTSAITGYGMEATNSLEGNEPWPPGTYEGWIVSEAVKYNASDVFAPSLQIDILAGVSGTVTVDVEAALLLEEQDPSLTFKYERGPSLSGHAGFYETFHGVSTMQCLGSTSYTPSGNPSGIPGSLEIDNGWFKATIRQTDPPTATGIRSEITLPAQALGDENWFTWEMLIKSSEWPDHTGQIILGQMHNVDSLGATAAVNFCFKAVNGRLYFVLPASEPPATSLNETRLDIGPLQLDHVYQMAVHAKWLNTSSGLMEVFVDGVKIPIGKPWNFGTAYNADAPYFKLGIYDAPHLADFGTKSARFRNLKRYSGNGSYSEVLAAGVPLPPQRLVGVI